MALKRETMDRIVHFFEMAISLCLFALIIYFTINYYETLGTIIIYGYATILFLLYIGLWIYSSGKIIKIYLGEEPELKGASKIKGKLLTTLVMLFVFANILTCSYIEGY